MDQHHQEEIKEDPKRSSKPCEKLEKDPITNSQKQNLETLENNTESRDQTHHEEIQDEPFKGSSQPCEDSERDTIIRSQVQDSETVKGSFNNVPQPHNEEMKDKLTDGSSIPCEELKMDTVTQSQAKHVETISGNFNDTDQPNQEKMQDKPSNGGCIPCEDLENQSVIQSQPQTLGTSKDVSATSSSDSESDVENADGEDDGGGDDDEFILPNGNNETELPPNADCNLMDASLLLNLSNLQIDYTKEVFVHIGNIANFIDSTVTIEATQNSESYDIDTVLFIEDGDSKKPFGGITDVIGPVSQPVYCVQLPSSKEVENLGLKQDMKVYSAPKSEYTKYVFLKDLLKMKGTDASWIGDQEQPSDEGDTSEEDEGVLDQHPTTRKRNRNPVQNQRVFNNNRYRHRGVRGNSMGMPRMQFAPQNVQMFPVPFDPTVPPPVLPTARFGMPTYRPFMPFMPRSQEGFYPHIQRPQRFQHHRAHYRNYNPNSPIYPPQNYNQ